MSSVLNSRRRLDYAAHAGMALLLGLVAVWACEVSGLDLAVSDRFYDFSKYAWIVDRSRDRWLGNILYWIPKYLVLGVTVACIVSAFARVPVVGRSPWRVVACFATFLTVPLIVAALKKTTDIYTPLQIERYHDPKLLPPMGTWSTPGISARRIPYRRHWENYGTPRPSELRLGNGFPAGHASAGFVLMGLAAFATTPQWRRRWIWTGTSAGWIMGTYQLTNGNHFVSHTIATWALAWTILPLTWMVWDPWGQLSRHDAQP
jgi:membrane-associated PAP2 superfamily phosphatase